MTSARASRFLVLTPLVFLTGCLTPNAVVTFHSADPAVYYTVETHHGLIRRKLDYTSVYAHLIVDGRSERKRILRGLDIENTRVLFHAGNSVDVCIPGDGNTVEFRSHVTLKAAGTSLELHNHLLETCQ